MFAPRSRAKIREIASIYFWLVPISGVLTTTKGNPFAIPFSAEVFSLMALLPFISHVAKRKPVTNFDIFILLSPLFWIIWSALAAKLTFGQPMWYGLVEQRRMLLLYLYFPFRFTIFSKLSPQTLLRPMLVLALIAAVLGILYWSGAVSGLRDLEVSRAEVREGRANLAAPFVAMTLIFWLVAWQKIRLRWYEFIALVLSFGFLLVVAQTRQILVGLAIAAFVYWLMQGRRARRFVAATALLLVVAGLGLSAILLDLPVAQGTVEAFAQLWTDQYLQESSRSRALQIVFQDFNFVGHGALSQQWRGGFLERYDGHFVLADIGIFGTIHTFGALAILIALETLLLLRFAVVNSYKLHGVMIGEAVLLYSIVLLALWPTAAILEMRSPFLALLIAMGAAAVPRKYPAPMQQYGVGAPAKRARYRTRSSKNAI